MARHPAVSVYRRFRASPQSGSGLSHDIFSQKLPPRLGLRAAVWKVQKTRATGCLCSSNRHVVHLSHSDANIKAHLQGRVAH